MTVLLQIANAMLAALNSGRPVGVPEARFWTGIAIEPEDLPRRTFGWSEVATERAGAPTSPLAVHRVTFVVQDLVAGPGSAGNTPQAICEAYRAWSVKALVANRYVGGDSKPLAVDTVETGSSWEFEQAEVPVCRCTHSFQVTFTSRASDAEQRA